MTHAKDEALQMCLEYIETDAHERKYVRHAIKQALAAQHEPENEPFVSLASVQEPVAWVTAEDVKVFNTVQGESVFLFQKNGKWNVPLYTTPHAQPAPVPLTDEQINAIRFSIPTKAVTQRDFELARAIESAHGIREKGQP